MRKVQGLLSDNLINEIAEELYRRLMLAGGYIPEPGSSARGLIVTPTMAKLALRSILQENSSENPEKAFRYVVWVRARSEGEADKQLHDMLNIDSSYWANDDVAMRLWNPGEKPPPEIVVDDIWVPKKR